MSGLVGVEGLLCLDVQCNRLTTLQDGFPVGSCQRLTELYASYNAIATVERSELEALVSRGDARTVFCATCLEF